MAVCDACQKAEGTNHVTVSVTVFGAKTTRAKPVQFWLCDSCEMASRQVLADDVGRRRRVAWRLTVDPQLFSRFRDWRESRFGAQTERIHYPGRVENGQNSD